MFYTYGRRNFLDWYNIANKLHKADFIEEGGDIKNFISLTIEKNEADHYLLFVNDKVGACGYAVLTPLSSTFCTQLKKIVFSAGTFVLKDVHFFIEADKFDSIDFDFFQVIEQFHLGLFQKLWDASTAAKNTTALVYDPAAHFEDESVHDDLVFFGGFKFSKKLVEEENEKCVALGVLPLNKNTYDNYLTKKTIHEKHFGKIVRELS